MPLKINKQLTGVQYDRDVSPTEQLVIWEAYWDLFMYRTIEIWYERKISKNYQSKYYVNNIPWKKLCILIKLH